MIELGEFLPDLSNSAVPIHVVDPSRVTAVAASISAAAAAWVASNAYKGAPGSSLVLPGEDGTIAAVLVGRPNERDPFAPLAFGALARTLPAGTYRLAEMPPRPDLAALGWLLGGYRFTRYRGGDAPAARLSFPAGAERERAIRIAAGCRLTCDLVNTPPNDLGPGALAAAVKALAAEFGATATELVGDDLLEANFPLIHAVGRAAAEPSRLVDFSWGDPGHPKITLVGKGVTFDTGGLDIKPPSAMLLMKKDMGGAANLLGLARMIMDAGLAVRLRVLTPIVENAISGPAFRPGDIIRSRKGATVEIGNTDAEGRLILADALTLADEEAPDLIVDMATLTGAARVALGPDLPPFYTRDDALADALARYAVTEADPVWRLPLWPPYDDWLNGQVADINNAPERSFAGSITAALFLSRFVEHAVHLHFDVYAWTPDTRPHAVKGGAAQGIRALFALLADRYRP